MNSSDSLIRRIAEVAQRLQAEPSSLQTIELAVQLAVEIVDGARDASLTLVQRNGVMETLASTSDRASQADRLQYSAGAGPCVQAATTGELASAPDLTVDERWPAWSPVAVREADVRSVLSLPMMAADRPIGSLNLYASEPDAFRDADLDTGASFAAHAAVAIASARLEEDQAIAMDSRTVIGQATGILMERFDIDAVRAFAALKRVSQDSNRKIREVAAELVRTGITPGRG